MSNDDGSAQPLGPLTEKALEFINIMARLVSDARGPVDAEYWAPLERFVAVEEFERLVPRNAFAGSTAGSDENGEGDPWSRPVIDWAQYVECFNMWVLASPRYSNVVQRIAEFPGLVYLEIEEHHGDHIFNSISIYEFNDGGQISRIRVAAAADGLTTPDVGASR